MKCRAFTVIEILVVIAIVAIVAALIFGPKEGEIKTFDRNGHLYFQKREQTGKYAAWGAPVHDPDCPKCARTLESAR